MRTRVQHLRWTAGAGALLLVGCGAGGGLDAPVVARHVIGETWYTLATDGIRLDGATFAPNDPRATQRQTRAATRPARVDAGTQAAGATTRPSSATTRPAAAGRVRSGDGFTRPSENARARIGPPGPRGPGDTGALKGAEAASKAAGADSLTVGGGRMSSLPSVSALSPRTLSGAGSRPGLQRGFAAALGFAGPHTILTPQRSGVASACQALVRGGFFANQAACERCFRR